MFLKFIKTFPYTAKALLNPRRGLFNFRGARGGLLNKTGGLLESWGVFKNSKSRIQKIG